MPPLWAKVYQADSRIMPELPDESVALAITSPPYWHLKDYGVEGQIGYGQSLHDYLRSLYQVWSEIYRVLKPGRRLCVNIGDQFARAVVYGRYKVIPLHAEVIAQAEQIGYDYMGAIIWQKRTTMNTTGGATVMGSYPYPPNGIVEIDYEFILIFKKPGKSQKVPREVKEASEITKEEWKTYFSGHWRFGGARQMEHEAVFPPELPKRLIRMFSFVGETVLDPFAGSGTTLAEALRLDRNAVGYEINPRFIELIKQKLEPITTPMFGAKATFERPEREHLPPKVPGNYTPSIQNAEPKIAPNKFRFGQNHFYRVKDISRDGLLVDTGLQVGYLGVDVVDFDAYRRYAQRYLLGKQIFLKFDQPDKTVGKGLVRAYVYLKNKIFVNAYLLKAGIARPNSEEHRLRQKFLSIWQGTKTNGQRVDTKHGH